MKIRCAAAALLSCTAMLAFAKDNASGQFEIRTLSNRADLISGGDALGRNRPMVLAGVLLNTLRNGKTATRLTRA